MITFKEKDGENPKPIYPCIGVYAGNNPDYKGLTVLFTEEHTGITLHAMGRYEIGYHTKTWKLNDFEYFDAEIALIKK